MCLTDQHFAGRPSNYYPLVSNRMASYGNYFPSALSQLLQRSQLDQKFMEVIDTQGLQSFFP